MKRLSWRKIKKIAFDHPYFDYKPHLLSEKEADRILSAGYIDVTEFIEIAKARYERQDYDMGFVLPEPERKARLPRNKLVARLAIGIAVILLFFAFLTFTEPGIALARAVRNFVVRIFEGSIIAQGYEPPNELPEIDFNIIPETFLTLEDAARIIGRPVIDARKDDLTTIKSIIPHVHGDGGMDIQVIYQLSSEETYYVIQQFYSNDMIWNSIGSVANSEVVEIMLSNGLKMYIGTQEDGTAFGEAFASGTSFVIMSIELMPEMITEIAKTTRFIQP